MNCLAKNQTWQLVEKQKGVKILDLKWVFTNKIDNRKKARLVVRGFQQDEILEDLYSPVAKVQTLKLLLTYCCQLGLSIEQMDVKTAFLNGNVKSEVYIKQSLGFEDGTNRVCKLKKALYGLRESPRAWYECFDDYIRKLGFKRSNNDYCLYIGTRENENIFVILFIDDLLICGRDKKKIDEIKMGLSKRFSMKDLGKVEMYLGIRINYDDKVGKMTLDQNNYIESLATKYDIGSAKLYQTSMEQNLSIEPAQYPSI